MKNKNLVSKIPDIMFEIFVNIFVIINIIPSKNIIILLLCLPKDFLRHSEDRFKNKDNFKNIPAVQSPKYNESKFSNLLIFAALVAVYIGKSFTSESSPKTPVTKNIILDIKKRTKKFQVIMPFFIFPKHIGSSIPIAGMHDILESIKNAPSVKELYPS